MVIVGGKNVVGIICLSDTVTNGIKELVSDRR